MLSTIKNIVAAPLAWFAHPEQDFEDTPGKRRRTRHPRDHYARNDDGEPRPLPAPKRMRIHSPPRQKQPTKGYLDPPHPPRRAPVRHSQSPFGRPPRPAPRTMSMDPPNARRISVREPSLVPLPLSRDVSMEAPTSFRLRSRTPQPPPLAALHEHPVFVKPPPLELQRRVSDSTVTLGSLVDKTVPVTRHSTLTLSSASTARPSPPRALHDLDIYRTPLIPTRLRSATPAPPNGALPTDSSLPSLFQSRHKARALVLMRRSAKDHKPRLGHASKLNQLAPALSPGPSPKDSGHAKIDKARKPYAGEGGLKKLLARRRQEEKEERAKEEHEGEDKRAMADDSALDAVRAPQPVKRVSKIAEPVYTPEAYKRKVSAPPMTATASQASLGVAAGRLPSRRPKPARAAGPTRNRKNKFSAVFDDEEEEAEERGPLLESVVEEPVAAPSAAKGKENATISAMPKHEAPNGFSFAPPATITPPPPPAAEPSERDEAPIAALPFSFTKTPAPKIMAPPTAAPEPPVIAFIPPTPVQPTAVPNFFADSSAFARGGVLPPPPSVPVAPGRPVSALQPSPFVEPPARAPSPAAQPAPVSAFTPPAPAPVPAPASFSFAAPPSVSAEHKPAVPSAPSSLPFTLTPKSSPSPTPAFTAEVPKPLFGGATAGFAGFGSTPAPAPTAEAPKPATAVPPAPAAVFTGFGTSAVPAPAPEATKPAFTFAPVPPAAPKPLAGGAAPGAFSFGAPQLAPEKEQKPAGFSFAPKDSGAAAPTATPQKPSLFAFAPPKDAAAPKSAFAFGAAPAATGGASAFAFGGPSTPAPPSKAFSFGGAGGPVTPPRTDNEMRMEESPTRGGFEMAINGNGNAGAGAGGQPKLHLQVPEPAKAGGFAFGGAGFGASPTPSPFGAAPGGGFAFSAGGQNQPASAGGFAFGQAKAPETVPSAGGFAFGTPKQEQRPASSGGFSFGQTKPVQPPPQPTSSFSFGQAADATRPASSGFAFGQPQPAADASRPSSSGFAFGQPQQQPQQQQPPATSPFSFPAPAAQTSTPFGQASAPASPAFATPAAFGFGGPTSAPPQPAPGPFGFSGGASLPPSPAVAPGGFSFNAGSGGAFGGVQGAAQGGSSLFTMGTAPAGARPVKKLPSRRGNPAKR